MRSFNKLSHGSTKNISGIFCLYTITPNSNDIFLNCMKCNTTDRMTLKAHLLKRKWPNLESNPRPLETTSKSQQKLNLLLTEVNFLEF